VAPANLLPSLAITSPESCGRSVFESSPKERLKLDVYCGEGWGGAREIEPQLFPLLPGSSLRDCCPLGCGPQAAGTCPLLCWLAAWRPSLMIVVFQQFLAFPASGCFSSLMTRPGLVPTGAGQKAGMSLLPSTHFPSQEDK
jgi:hypothetical protein